MNRKELLALLLGILILVAPLYTQVYMRKNLFSLFSFPAHSEKTGAEEEEAYEMPVEEETGSETEVKSTGIYHKIGTFVVNIAHTEAQRFLKTTITLELSEKGVYKEINKKDTVIRDIIIGILSSKDFPEIEDIKAKDNLRRELMDAINSKLETGKVINIYFEEFVAQ